MLTESEILKALSQIVDPDLHKDIVSLGFVRNIKIKGKDVSFDLALTTPACPVRTQFQTAAEDLVRKLGATTVLVNLTTLPAQKQGLADSRQNALQDVKSIIAISSAKGGVGKSTMAAYVAVELAQRGFKVGLVDVDIHGPSVPTLFDLHNVNIYANEKKQLIPILKDNLKIMSFGFLLGDAPAVMRGPMVTRYVQEILLNTAWGQLDYLFIDMPPGTGDVQITITQSLRLSGAVIVTTRQSLSLVDVSRGILMFEKVDVPVLGIIENMAYFVCDNCSKRHDIFGPQNDSLVDRFGLETLAEIPLLPQFTTKLEGKMSNAHIATAVDNMIRSLGRNSFLQKEVPQISFDEQHTRLKWLDGEELSVSNRDLRLSCRCALCVNEVSGEQILQPESVKPDIAPLKIIPLGNYALGIEWNDGHTSGIYPYKNIRKLAQKGTTPF